MFTKCKYDKGLFRLAKEINATNVITKIIAFQPPKKEGLSSSTPSTRKKQKHCSSYEKVKFVHELYSKITYKWIEETCYIFKNTNEHSRNKDKNLIILHLKNKNKAPDGYTLIISHGNASTLGTIYPLLIDFCTQLKCDIIAYDYSGYGRSEGKPSEKEIYTDIEEVGFFVKNILSIPSREIILMGHSLGSAPTVHLAIHKSYKDIRAMILLSPIASGVKLVSPEMSVSDLDKIDVFCNIRKIVDVSCPIFIVHGRKDEVIPIEQSIEMAQYMKNPYEWHPRHGDHGNILTKYRTKFFQKCKFFLDYLNCHTKKGRNGNSVSTFNFGDKPHLEGIHHYIEESYYGQHKEENGLTSKPEENLISLKGSRCRVFTLHPVDMESSKLSHLTNSSKKGRVSSEHDIPFDLRSEGSLSFSNKNNSGELTRESKESVYYKNHKCLEEQYTQMLVKHNGI